MTRYLLSFGFGIAVLGAALAPAPAQDAKGPPPAKGKAPESKGSAPRDTDDYRRFFKPPETAAEFWNAITYELDVGRPDLAARHLHAFIAKQPSDEDLVRLSEDVGTAALLRLRNVARWSDDPKLEAQARADADELVGRVGAAVKAVRGDPKRIAQLIGDLTASPEENSYAIKELYKSGPQSVPYLIDALKGADAGERAAVLRALGKLGRDALPPMLAALDSKDEGLKADLLDVLRARGATEAVPELWFLSASPSERESVRRRAAALLTTFLDLRVGRLPDARAALTREADRYYRHEVRFLDPKAVTVWRWDGKRVVAGWPGAATVPASRAEEYYGRRYSGQALELDPGYAPAQVVLLSLTLDQAEAQAGPTRPLAKAVPSVHDLAAGSNPDLLTSVLDRALNEHRTPVVLGAARVLGGLGEPRLRRPSGSTGQPPLVRALYYPDRRVQMAAAEALLALPGAPPSPSGSQVVDVLRRALAAEPAPAAAPKVLVGYSNDDIRGRAAEAVRKAGFEPVAVESGRAVLQRLNAASDIDLLVLDAGLPDPGLASLLAQLRADDNNGLLPVLLTTTDAAREDALRRYAERYPNVTVESLALVVTPKEFQSYLRRRLADPASSPPLSDAELNDYAERAARNLARIARGEVRGYDVRPARGTLHEAIRSGRLGAGGQEALISAVGRITDPRVQGDLSAVVLDARRPLAVRRDAAQELVRHVQQHSPLLSRTELAALEALYAQKDTDPDLRGDLALLLGSLRPDARVTGERLLRFQPPAPAPPPPPKPK